MAVAVSAGQVISAADIAAKAFGVQYERQRCCVHQQLQRWDSAGSFDRANSVTFNVTPVNDATSGCN
jgi:hypothetical protein